MTISKMMEPLQYATDGVQVNFPYDDKIFAAADLEVYLLNAAQVETRAVLNQDYTVNGEGQDSGGAVVFNTAPAASQTLTIRRALPLVQLTDYVENDAFPAQTHEDALDKAVMLIQQLHEQASRSLRLPPSFLLSGQMPAPMPNHVIGWDSLGAAPTQYPLTPVAGPEITGISQYEDSLAQAVATIGAGAKTLLVNKAITVSANLNVPENIQVWVNREGRITVDGCTLTINCTAPGGLTHIFNCINGGRVIFGPGAIKAYYPQWEGAKGDGVTDDAAAINAAALTCRASFDAGQLMTLTFPPGVYVATTALDLSSCSVNQLPKAVIRSGVTTGAAVTVGESTSDRINKHQDERNFGKTLILEVEQDGTYNAGTGRMDYDYPAGTVGILIQHYDRSRCTIRRSAGFATGVKLAPPTGGCIGYNEVNLGFLQNTVDVHLDATNGFVSVNDFYGGSFGSPNAAGSTPIGVKFTGAGNNVNRNTFHSPVFELGQPGGGGFSYCAWWDDELIGDLGKVGENKFIDAYVEGTDFGARFGNYTGNNEFEAAYISVTGFTLGVPASTSPAYDQNYAWYKPSLLKDWGKVLVCQKWLTGGHQDAGGYYWPIGLSCFDGSLTPKHPLKKATTSYFGVDYVTGAENRAYGVYVETHKFKTFRLEISHLAGYNPGRIFVKCFDANFVELTGIAPAYVSAEYYTNIPADSGLTWNATGAYLGAGYADAWNHLTFRSEVKYAWIGVGNGDTNVRATGFSLWAFLPEGERQMVSPFHATRVAAPKAFAFPAGFGSPAHLFAAAAPVTGIFESGQQAVNIAGASGQPSGWQCSSRVDTTVRIQANAADVNIEVVATAGMLAGDIIGIILDNGTTHWTTMDTVTDGDTAKITNAIPGGRYAAVGAKFYTNRWKALANIP